MHEMFSQDESKMRLELTRFRSSEREPLICDNLVEILNGFDQKFVANQMSSWWPYLSVTYLDSLIKRRIFRLHRFTFVLASKVSRRDCREKSVLLLVNGATWYASFMPHRPAQFKWFYTEMIRQAIESPISLHKFRCQPSQSVGRGGLQFLELFRESLGKSVSLPRTNLVLFKDLSTFQTFGHDASRGTNFFYYKPAKEVVRNINLRLLMDMTLPTLISVLDSFKNRQGQHNQKQNGEL